MFQEIGYSETILDVRSFRIKNLLGMIPPGQWPSNGKNSELLRKVREATGGAVGGGGEEESDSSSDGRGGGAGGGIPELDGDVAEAFNEFSFLKKVGKLLTFCC